MNATDYLASGLVLFVGGLWLKVAGLPGAEVPVLGLNLYSVGAGVLAHGVVQVVRIVRGGVR